VLSLSLLYKLPIFRFPDLPLLSSSSSLEKPTKGHVTIETTG